MYRCDRKKIQKAFWEDGVLAYPTEGVWGLGCHPTNERAVQKILALKGRPVEKGVILVTGDIRYVEFLLQYLPATQQAFAQTVWPGHVTLLIEDVRCQIPWFIKGDHNTVAIRVSLHPLIQWFSQTVSPFLVSTSANRAGKSACRFHWQVQHQFSSQVDYIVPGNTLGAKGPSEIIHLASRQVVR